LTTAALGPPINGPAGGGTSSPVDGVVPPLPASATMSEPLSAKEIPHGFVKPEATTSTIALATGVVAADGFAGGELSWAETIMGSESIRLANATIRNRRDDMTHPPVELLAASVDEMA